MSGTDVTSDFAGQQRGGDGAESDWRNQYEILDLAPRYWQAVEYPGKMNILKLKNPTVVSKRKIIEKPNLHDFDWVQNVNFQGGKTNRWT